MALLITQMPCRQRVLISTWGLRKEWITESSIKWAPGASMAILSIIMKAVSAISYLYLLPYICLLSHCTLTTTIPFLVPYVMAVVRLILFWTYTPTLLESAVSLLASHLIHGDSWFCNRCKLLNSAFLSVGMACMYEINLFKGMYQNSNFAGLYIYVYKNR